MAYTENRNLITLGDKSGKKQSILEIPAQTASDKPGVLSLVAVADNGTRTAYYYWSDSNGVFRQHTSIPTNQDSDGSAVAAASAALPALSNLAAVAINTSLVSDANNTDDLGSNTYSFRTAYLGTSLVFKEATANATIAADDHAVARTYTFPDAGAAANIMLDTGAANVIAYTKGTSTIAMAANADLSIATGITLTVTAACTLDQNLAVAGTPTFASLTAGTTNIAAAVITDSSGAISFGNENLTTTGTINLASDSINITLGASGATDSRIYFDGAGNLMLYDSNLVVARSLTELYTGTSLNPTVSGNLTIGDGNFTWTNTSAAETAVFTLAATTVDGIQIASSNTSADVIQITANATTSGSLLSLISVDATMTSGAYIYCYDGGAQDFAVRRYGATTIAGSAAGTASLTLTTGDAVLSSGRITQTSTADVSSSFYRNNAVGTGAVVSIQDAHVNGGVTLLVNSDVTDDIDALQITHDGVGYGISVVGSSVTGKQAYFAGPAAQTTSIVTVDGSTGTGWVGAATTGMVGLITDGAVAADASLLRIASSGQPAAANDGICLDIVESGAAQATSYAVKINSASNEALHVAQGTALFDEKATFTASIQILCSDKDSTNPPTNNECIAEFGAAATVGAGFIAIIDDANGHTNEYIIWSDGTKFWQVTGTACA
jgi:hypothetical protein